ncbi:MAG: glycosyltransferase, partial [Candidatus Gracilibacteria bacterium]|nr:glycosyltransferase [Candidatus Gracilibacteria bacterium]
MKKTIILHDTFLYKGGGERLIMMMGKSLGADIASGFFSAGSFDLRKEGFSGEMISLTSEIFTKGFRHVKLKFAFMFKTGFLKNYENVIFSGDSISGVRNCTDKQNKIYYCHTPPRYLYDLHEIYVKKVPLLIRPIFKIACYIFKKLYESDIKKMDLILTNSKNTQKRIKDFLGIDSKILYPPVDLKLFKFINQKDYYLSFARLADAKRVDRIVEAFKILKDKKLVIIYGENDPQKEKIFNLAKDYENIKFVTLPGNIGFTDYIGNSIATIYIPIDEDFGMSPVESMAAGKPVIGVNEGGLKESIIHNKTGVLINKDCRVEDIIDAIKFLTPENSLNLKNNCEKRAKDFSLESFGKQLNSY